MNKVIIIDDEPLAISVVRDYLQQHAGFEIVEECLNGFDGLKAIQKHSPDLVFLDVQMPKITGFEMLELLDEKPGIIFTTAFDEYAIKAFDIHAVDYLLKPFSRDRFNAAIKKWNELRESGAAHTNVSGLNELSSATISGSSHDRIVVKSGNTIRIIPHYEIIYIEAYDDYIKIHVDKDCFLKKQTMGKTELLLDEKTFTRVHRSYIINLSQITAIEPLGKETYSALLRNNTRVPLSKQGYTKLKNVLGI